VFNKGTIMYKTIFSLLFISVFSFNLFSQEIKSDLKDDMTRLQNGEDVNVLYRNEASFGVFIHSAGGFGIGYRRGEHVTGKRKKMFEIESSNFKHAKEVKTVNNNYANSKGFVYGKLNSILLFRSGVGFQNILYQKSDKKSVEIRYSYFVGTTLAFAKPVYLEAKTSSSSSLPSIQKYTPDIPEEDIYGKAPFFNGIGGTTIYPAGYAKFALSFDYADRYNDIKSIETGIIADAYPKALPIMAFNKKQQVYLSLYLKIMWGKKWF
jgi:hypothetical protein